DARRRWTPRGAAYPAGGPGRVLHRRGEGARRGALAGPDERVRAQGRPRRGGCRRSDVGVRGCRAPAPRGDPARVSDDVSRGTTPSVPPEARRVFASDRLPLAERYAELLATEGVVRGLIGPREAPRLWDRHLMNSAVLQEALPDGAS